MNKQELRVILEDGIATYRRGRRDSLKTITKEALYSMRLNKSLVESLTSYQKVHYFLYVKSMPTKLAERELILEVLLSEKAIFQAFRDHLEEEVRTILDALIWSDKLADKTIKEKFNIEIATHTKEKHSWSDSTYYQSSLIKKFKLFNSEEKYNWSGPNKFILSLPLEFRQLMVRHYDKPETATIKPLRKQELAETEYTFEGEIPIFTELLRMHTYYVQGNITTTTKGYPSATTLNKMKRGVGIKEFYQTKAKTLVNLRTHLLSHLLIYTNTRNKLPAPELFIQHLFIHFKSKSVCRHVLFPHVSGMHQIRHFQQVEEQLWDLLKKLPVNGDWVGSENLVDYIRYNFLGLIMVSAYDYNNYLKLGVMIDNKKNKLSAGDFPYEKVITENLIKGAMFLFAAYGLVDIKYDNVGEIDGENVFSPFDGLKYVRLNDLGRYILNYTETYETKTVIKDNTITLDKDNLMVVVDDDNNIADILLKGYVQRVGKNRYHTDAVIFMEDCKTEKELDNKITFFQQTVAGELPPNWTTFFAQLKQQANPFKSTNEHILLQIPDDDKTLIHLIAKDIKLKKYVLRAEDFHIIVFKNKMTAFKKRLRELGYLMD